MRVEALTSQRPTFGTIIILATAVATFGTAVMGLYVSFQNKTAIQEVHIIMNSRLTELLDLTQKAAHAAGVKEGEENQGEIP